VNASTAWVTGGSSGIGRAVVDRLVASGCEVGVIDLADPGRIDVTYQPCDLAEPASVAAALAGLGKTAGPPEGLVLCAGVAASQPVEGHDEATWRRVIEVNLTSALLLISHVLGPMRARGRGRIVTVASGTAVRVGRGSAAYAASKAGLIALTKTVALEAAADGVTANVVAPGVTDTPMTRAAFGSREAIAHAAVEGPLANPQGAPLDPSDVAGAIAFLLGDDASRITGQVLHVNGGSLMP
jgi:NAD(P)-dependent dehydrogenase (short-subunit alcohol dehydrogenase family)